MNLYIAVVTNNHEGQQQQIILLSISTGYSTTLDIFTAVIIKV
jgi:hypothetical protein